MLEYSAHQDTAAIGVAFDKHLGIGLADAGFLVTYRPLEKLEFKTTLVYTPWANSLQEYFVEVSGAYLWHEGFNIALGKFLTPLSPTNLYFYAPLNPSGTLPSLISHHFLFPQSISGLQFKGTFGNSFKMGYNFTYGNYIGIGHPNGGVLGILGQEDVVPYLGFFERDTEESAHTPLTFLGGTGRIYFDYEDMFSIGLNLFEGTKGRLAILALDGSVDFFAPSSRRSYGADIHLNLSGFEMNAEYWQGSTNPNDDNLTDVEYIGYYGEIIYNIENLNLKPWIRYEYIEDAKGEFGTAHPLGVFDVGQQVEAPMSSYSGGIAYRPFYELLLKLEYRHFMLEDHVDQSSPFASVLNKMEDYDYFQISAVLSF